jgi:hypothetical protein
MKAIILTLFLIVAAAGSWWLLFTHNSGLFNSTYLAIAICLPALALLKGSASK